MSKVCADLWGLSTQPVFCTVPSFRLLVSFILTIVENIAMQIAVGVYPELPITEPSAILIIKHRAFTAKFYRLITSWVGREGLTLSLAVSLPAFLTKFHIVISSFNACRAVFQP